MALYVKAFVFVVLVYFASAAPLEGQESEDAQLGLFGVDSVTEENVQSLSSNDDLTRSKRHYYGKYLHLQQKKNNEQAHYTPCHYTSCGQ